MGQPDVLAATMRQSQRAVERHDERGGLDRFRGIARDERLGCVHRVSVHGGRPAARLGRVGR